jgi:hypothetical protein
VRLVQPSVLFEHAEGVLDVKSPQERPSVQVDYRGVEVADVIIVSYPYARWAVMDALASLSDREHQERVWIERDLPAPGYVDNLDQAVHTLYDDWAVLPDPRKAIEAVLVDGPEVDRLIVLGDTLDRLIDELGDVPDADYLAHKDWSTVRTQAGAALVAMVLAGSFMPE